MSKIHMTYDGRMQGTLAKFGDQIVRLDDENPSKQFRELMAKATRERGGFYSLPYTEENWNILLENRHE
jgi:hypothetical protein